MLCEAGGERLFVSANLNSASVAFFQKQDDLKLVTENERYRVFSPLRSVRVKAMGPFSGGRTPQKGQKAILPYRAAVRQPSPPYVRKKEILISLN